MRRVDRLRKECKDGAGLARMQELLYLKANDESEALRDRVAAAREWRMVTRDLGGQQPEQGDVLDDLAARRKARRNAG